MSSSAVCSMTGYGSAQGALPNGGSFVIEIKTVNHRFLEANVKLAPGFEALEIPIQKLLKSKLQRGRCDAFLSRKFNFSGNRAPAFESSLFETSALALEEGLKAFITDPVERKRVVATELISRADIFRVQEEEGNRLLSEEVVLPVLSAALEQVLQMRRTEGESLKEVLLQYLVKIENFVGAVTPLVNESIERFRQRVSERLKQVELPLAEDRLAIEVALLADRSDVSEELARLTSHVAQFRSLLAQGGEIGKRLDFLVQEMGREVNTTGSKSQSAGISSLVVETKAVLEKIKEQVQNVE